MQEPEWPPFCECKYDEVHDRMDREDCLLHCDMQEEVSLLEEHPERQTGLKKPATVARPNKENAA
jgi:hypothetical protein